MNRRNALFAIGLVAVVTALPLPVPTALSAENPLKVPVLSGIVELTKAAGSLSQPSEGGKAPTKAGTNYQVNQDTSNFPQNETAIAVNPTNRKNVVAGANDYRTGSGYSGFYTSFDGGKTWIDGIVPIPSWPDGDTPDAGGDPAIVFDSKGVVYYVGLAFERSNNRSAVVVNRSTDGGRSWSRPSFTTGDGIVFTNVTFSGSTVLAVGSDFADKEWMAVGPRPGTTQPLCRQASGSDPGTCQFVGTDRLYVTWTRFSCVGTAACVANGIFEAHSDDGARTWSTAHQINGTSPLCDINGLGVPTPCTLNQPSWPAVLADGTVVVIFRNTDTPAENQFLAVRSTDGGATFADPVRVGWAFDITYPTASSAGLNCTGRGQQSGRPILRNSCFRVNSYGGPAAHPTQANVLYFVWSDNRNGDSTNTDVDVFLCRSTDGGLTWTGAAGHFCAEGDANNASRVGPVRVNRDPVGNDKDQWFPWVAVAGDGTIDVVFYDRRLDTTSTITAFGNPISPAGNYLVDAFVARSRDGGSTWSEYRASSVSSNMDFAFRGGIFIGDYNAIVNDIYTSYPFWTDARNGTAAVRQSDVFTALMQGR